MECTRVEVARRVLRWYPVSAIGQCPTVDGALEAPPGFLGTGVLGEKSGGPQPPSCFNDNRGQPLFLRSGLRSSGGHCDINRVGLTPLLGDYVGRQVSAVMLADVAGKSSCKSASDRVESLAFSLRRCCRVVRRHAASRAFGWRFRLTSGPRRNRRPICVWKRLFANCLGQSWLFPWCCWNVGRGL